MWNVIRLFVCGREGQEGEAALPLSQGSRYDEAEHADLISRAATEMDTDF